MTVKFTSNSKLFLKGLDKLKERAVNTAPLMFKIANDMKSKVDMRFRHSKDPNGVAWEPLKESTIERRRNSDPKNKKKSGGKALAKPLIDNGDLRKSIHAKYNSVVAIAGTNLKYAAMQNYGAKRGELGITPVEETVRAHQRRRRKTNEMADVRQHRRTRRVASPWGDVPARPFIGFSNNQIKQYAAMINKHLKGEKK